MKSFLSFLKVTLAGGIFFVLPVILIYILLGEALEAVASLASVTIEAFGIELPEVMPHPYLFAIVFLVALSFIVGLAMRTPGVRRLIALLERQVLERLPGYRVLRTMSKRLGGQETDGQFRPVLVRLPTGAQAPGFLLEDIGDNRHSVFFPSAPTPGVGTVQIVPEDQIEELAVPAGRVIEALGHWGFGLREAIGCRPSEQPTTPADS